MIVAMHLQANSWMNKVFLSATSFPDWQCIQLFISVYPSNPLLHIVVLPSVTLL